MPEIKYSLNASFHAGQEQYDIAYMNFSAGFSIPILVVPAGTSNSSLVNTKFPGYYITVNSFLAPSPFKFKLSDIDYINCGAFNYTCGFFQNIQFPSETRGTMGQLSDIGSSTGEMEFYNLQSLVPGFPNVPLVFTFRTYPGSVDTQAIPTVDVIICNFGADGIVKKYLGEYNFFNNSSYLYQTQGLFISTTSSPQYISPVNPYEPNPPSAEGNLPPGTFDDSSDAISDSPLPTLSAANTGFTRIYNPTLAQVKQLAKYLWTDDTVIETIWNHIKQYFEDPMQAIIGFNLVPVPVPDGGTQNFALMYIDTGVSMTVAANQFVDVDCGTFALQRYYGSALDQSPYTKVHCYLPFIGMVHLNTDEVMGTTLQVKYRVDIVSGSCVAKILVDGSVLYQYSGHCAITIPINSANFSEYVSAAINTAKIVGGGVAAGAVNGAIAATNTGFNLASGIGIGAKIGFDSSINEILQPENVSSTVSQVMGSKPNIEHSGSFNGNSGYLGVRRPYLIIERPNMCLPENFQSLNGYPAMITMSLETCTGFTRVQQVQLTGLNATQDERAEIMQLLKVGVVF